MRSITFTKDALLHLDEWRKTDPKMLSKIVSIVTDIASNPFFGIGKPEPLKYNLKGKWSRRISDEHRIVYEITDNTILIISCRHHYT